MKSNFGQQEKFNFHIRFNFNQTICARKVCALLNSNLLLRSVGVTFISKLADFERETKRKSYTTIFLRLETF